EAPELDRLEVGRAADVDRGRRVPAVEPDAHAVGGSVGPERGRGIARHERAGPQRCPAPNVVPRRPAIGRGVHTALSIAVAVVVRPAEEPLRVVGVDGDGRFVLRGKEKVLVHRDVRAYVRSAQARDVEDPGLSWLDEVRLDYHDAGELGNLTNLPTDRPIEEAELGIGPRGLRMVATRRNTQHA